MKERDITMDLVKSFSILAVIISHLFTYQVVNSPVLHEVHDILYSFNMPLFAIVSGYFFSMKTDAKSFVRHKVVQLLLPVLCWSIIAMLVFRIIHDVKSYGIEAFHFLPYLRDFWKQLSYSAWFLKALFLCFVYFYLSLRLLKSRVLLAVVCSTILLYFLALFGVIPNKNPWFEGFIFLYPFFSLGFFVKKKCLFEKVNLRFWFLISLICWGSLYSCWMHTFCFYTVNTSMFAESFVSPYPNAPLIYGLRVPAIMFYRFTIGIAGSFMVLFFVKWMAKHIKSSKLCMYSANLGKYTLGCYLMQDIILPLMRGTVIGEWGNASFLFTVFLTFLLWIFMSYFVKYTSGYGCMSLFVWGRKSN